MADMTLFCLPATQLNMVSKQLAILELSLLASLRGLEQVIAASINRDDDTQANLTPFQKVMKGVGSLFAVCEDGYFKVMDS